MEKVETTETMAMTMLKNNVSVADRATNYMSQIKRNIQRDVIDELIASKDKLEGRLFELKDFTLDTNINSGQKRMTAEECEARFKEIIEIEFALVILTQEIEVKQASFNKYFTI